MAHDKIIVVCVNSGTDIFSRPGDLRLVPIARDQRDLRPEQIVFKIAATRQARHSDTIPGSPEIRQHVVGSGGKVWSQIREPIGHIERAACRCYGFGRRSSSTP